MNAKSIIKEGTDLVTDAAITAAIKTKFFKDSFLNSADIHVVTEKAIVTLSGKLFSAKEAMQAIKIAEKTIGVKKVISNIQVIKS